MAVNYEDQTTLFNFVVKQGNGVKGLIDSGMSCVPQPFVQPLSERITTPHARTCEAAQPIDLSQLDGPRHKEVAKQIIEASETLGFFQFFNLRIDLGLLLGFGVYGGNSKVYRGVLEGKEVAVKRIMISPRENVAGTSEFLAEVSSLGRLRHKNIVGLRGWCKKGGESLLLVYEYMENGSVDKRIFDSDKMLSWEERMRVIRDVASGMLYLHEGWESKVLHRDIKLSNVLLDKDMNARVGDFGLAKLQNTRKEMVSTTHVVGTAGYMAPELVKTGRASAQTDVYSFGVFVLEVVCGRRPIEEGREGIVEWMWGLMEKDQVVEGLDDRIKERGRFETKEAEMALRIGLLCVHPDPRVRPTMRQVHILDQGRLSDDGDERDREGMEVSLLERMKSSYLLGASDGRQQHPTFLDVVNHGVSVELLELLKTSAHEFFEQPPEKKAVYLKEVSPSKLVKYGTSFVPEKEKAIEWKDYVSMLYTNDLEVLQHWPQQCREVALEFLKSSMAMVKRVVEVLMEDVGVRLEEEKMNRLMGTKMVNMNYYPTCPSPELTIGVGRHSDMGMLTVLLQDGIGGLYVKLDNGDWAEIPPLNGALVINVGDTLQILSNGKYKSAEHRARTTNIGSRVSVPIFTAPYPSEKIGPLPEVVRRDGVARYKELLFQDYMNNFFGQPHDGKKSLDFARAD